MIANAVIVQGRVVLKKTVVGVWRFDNLSGSHLQSQVNSVCQSMMLEVWSVERDWSVFHNILTTVMTRIIVDKCTGHAKPRLIINFLEARNLHEKVKVTDVVSVISEICTK